MLGSCDLVAFVATTDPLRARTFYEGSLGLRFIADEPYALIFEAKGTLLRVQKVEALTPAPYTTIGWRVPNIEAAVRELLPRGVTFERYAFIEQDELGVWRTPDGARVAWFKDPDGNTLSLTQVRPGERPQT